MSSTAQRFHTASTVLLAIGFVGVGALVFDAAYLPYHGVNIGLAILALPCLASGAVGIALGVVATVNRLIDRRRRRGAGLPR
ncbi:MAG: hypothetical protein INR72_16685 [Williamsia herbipolensis]|nr:hypothetical protein [Williamsia herbipolensis]